MKNIKGMPFKYALHAIVLGGVAFALYKLSSETYFLLHLKNFNPTYLFVLAILSFINFLLKSLRFVYLLEPVSKTSTFTAVKAYMAGQAVSLLPGGVASRAAFMKQAGVSLKKSAWPVLLVGLLDQIMLVAGLLLVGFLFPGFRVLALGITATLLVVAGLVAVKALRSRLESVLNSILVRVNSKLNLTDLKENLQKIFTWQTIIKVLLLTLSAFVLALVMFELIFVQLGQRVDNSVTLITNTAPVLLGRNVPIPAGLGVTEGGMVGYLTKYAGLDLAVAAAGVAIFRLNIVFLQAFVGALVYFFLWKGKDEKSTANI